LPADRSVSGYWQVALGMLAFVVLATMNSAGYRYGASDQAFYIPAVVRHLEPADFPADRPLIDSQARLTAIDETIAALVRLTGLSLQQLFAALYVITLGLIFTGAMLIGSRLYRTRGAVAALGAALTLRHAIAKTGANTLEAYFHPRQLAFAFGILAVAAFLGRKDRTAILLVLCAGAMHPTTAMWFAIWLGVALWFGRPRSTLWFATIAGAAGLGIFIAMATGMTSGRFVRMDPAWLAVIADKDYLFPASWPPNVWLTNLITVPIVMLCWRARQRASLTVPGETALVLGAMTLLLIFMLSLPFNAMRIAIAIQLQIPRIFWMLDFMATLYLVWWMCEAGGAGGATGARGAQGASRTRAAAVAVAIVALSTLRGAYACLVEFPDRKVFALDIADPDWREAMAWAQTTDPGSGWLADPMHAVIYGSSLRAAGHRDVLLERVKDHAIALYDRSIAMRVADRERALEALVWNTPDGARGLARRFGLDYLIVDRELDLPLAHRSRSLFVYRIR
jgi:hypothetical protein